MSKNVKITVKKDNTPAFLKKLADMPALKVGVTAEKGSKKHPNADTTVAQIGLYNEVGTMDIPARSFLRSWLDENTDKIATHVQADVLTLANSTAPASEKIAKRGAEYIKQIKKRIKAGIKPANSPTTLALKKGTTPLIDTTTLINAINWELDD